MSATCEILDAQITNCKRLLSVFLDERKNYLEKKDIKVNEVMNSLLEKMKLVDKLEEIKKIIHKANSESTQDQLEVKSTNRQKIRQLQDLLERLLVIEHENDLLLKRALQIPFLNTGPRKNQKPNKQFTQGTEGMAPSEKQTNWVSDRLNTRLNSSKNKKQTMLSNSNLINYA